MSMTGERLVSLVVPVWQDIGALSELLHTLPPDPDVETIVAVARDEAMRYRELQTRYDLVHWVTAPRGRGAQMDAGAAVAGGRWLLFVHADSRLPPDWREVIRDADQRPRVVGGAFRLAIDSRDWRARVLECAVRFRVAVFRLPYGDQALFVRRSVFGAIGGFRGLPLMEDVDIVRRLKTAGTLHVARSAVTTSGRRWERGGWMRQSCRNVMLLARYMAGADPTVLARAYYGRKPAAIVMMARAPWTGGKTRLHIEEPAHALLRRALLEDTLDVIRSVSAADPIVACEPADEIPGMRQLAGAECEVIGQRGDSLGDRLAHAFDSAFQRGYRSVVVIGSDIPDLPERALRSALASLEDGSDQVALGPARDGGYYLIGLNKPHRHLFRDIDWSTGQVLQQTLERAAGRALPVCRLEEWSDVDDVTDLDRFAMRGPSAPRTREWVARHLHPTSAQPESVTRARERSGPSGD